MHPFGLGIELKSIFGVRVMLQEDHDALCMRLERQTRTKIFAIRTLWCHIEKLVV